jgi:hypothetical protein
LHVPNADRSIHAARRQSSPPPSSGKSLAAEDIDTENPPATLNTTWLAALLVNVNSHIVSAVERAARLREPLDRLADAAEDAAALGALQARIKARWTIEVVIAVMAIAIAALGFSMWRSAHAVGEPAAGITAVAPDARVQLRLGGVTYDTSRNDFELRMRSARPDKIEKYYVEIQSQQFPVKQAVAVGTLAPRATFGSGDAIRALRKLGYATKEMRP